MNYSLLIVDDEELIRKGIRARLEYLEISFSQIYEASSGSEALQILRACRVDIVVTDIRMPQMSGLELMEEGQKLQEGISYIVLSGYAEFEYAKRALELGAKAYLLKPLSNEELKREFEQLFVAMEKDSAHSRLSRERMEYSLEKGTDAKSKIQLAIRYIQNHYAEDIAVNEMAEKFSMSPNYFSSMFKKETNKSAVNYITEYRIQKARDYLVHSEESVVDIAKKVGYEDSQYFFRVFKKAVGVTPLQYRRQHRKE